MICWLSVAVIAAALSNPGPTLVEASGIVRWGQTLLIVSDDDPGAYYRFPLPAGIRGDHIRVLDLVPVERVGWPLATAALDLESIEILGDGRIVALSEQLAAVVGEEGVVVEYEGRLTKFGERGLEGLAVRTLHDRRSRIAVLWEGGYPRFSSVATELRERFGRTPMAPVIWVHDLAAGSPRVRIHEGDALRTIALDIPRPAGAGPEAQRFRSPDLVWHYIVEGSREEWGFIALLSSENSIDRPRYAHHWLQRFGADGRRIGDPVDLDQVLPGNVRGVNWEGLGWYEPGRSLVLVYEHRPEREPPRALVFPLPAAWR